MDVTRYVLVMWFALFMSGCSAFYSSAKKTDSMRDNLKGRVKIVRIESAKLTFESGQWVEKPLTFTEIKTYDGKGNLIEETQQNLDGSLLVKTIHSYKSDGTKSESVVTDSKGAVSEKSVYVYDSGGLLIERASYKGEGSLKSKSIYRYEEDKRSEWVLTNSRGAIADKWTYKYDSTGALVEENRLYADGSTDITHIYKNDDRGNPIEKAIYSPDGPLIEKEEYSYEFDPAGNWIKKTTSRWVRGHDENELRPVEKMSRSIIYY